MVWATLAIAVAMGCGGTSTDVGSGNGNGGSGGGSGSSSGGGSGSSGSGSGGSGESGAGSGSGSGGVSAGSSGGSGSGGGSSSSSGSGGIVSSTGVSILVYPNGNHASELIAAINGAKTSVYMTMYEIDDSGIIDAIVSQKNAGLDVQVILDGSTTTKSNNTDAYNGFNSAKIPVVWSSPNFTFTHEKCVMIDHKQAWIMTTNAESSVPEDNREYIAIDNDPADVKEAEAIFNADHAMQSIVPTGDLVVANKNARPDLVTLINSAKKSLDIEDEEFSDNDSSGITDAVVSAAGRGVTVRLIVAGGSTDSTQTTALDDVKSGGRDGLRVGRDERRRLLLGPVHPREDDPRRLRDGHVHERVRRLGEHDDRLARVQPRTRRNHHGRDAARHRVHGTLRATSTTRRTPNCRLDFASLKHLLGRPHRNRHGEGEGVGNLDYVDAAAHKAARVILGPHLFPRVLQPTARMRGSHRRPAQPMSFCCHFGAGTGAVPTLHEAKMGRVEWHEHVRSCVRGG